MGWIYARRAPERIHRLVLEDTAPPSGRNRYPTVPEAPDEAVDYDWRARHQRFRELNALDEAWSDDPSSVAVPTLVISGRRDSGELGDMAAALPLGALVTIEAGHWIHETAPDAFVATVRRFLDGG